MVGAIGYTNKASVIKDIAWINVDYYGTKYYYSLFAASFPFADEVDSFKGCADYSNTCDHCNDDGHSAYIMTIIACLSAISCATMSIALIKHSDFWLMQYAVVAGAASSFLMSGVALCVFMGEFQCPFCFSSRNLRLQCPFFNILTIYSVSNFFHSHI